MGTRNSDTSTDHRSVVGVDGSDCAMRALEFAVEATPLKLDR
jgi:hypothetical protein